MRVLTVFGTRPEAIKMAPIVNQLRSRSDVEHRVCVTAQHRDMLDPVLELFEIRPDYDLDIMKEKQDLTYVTTAALAGLHEVIEDFRPDRILVQGDTTTTFAAALSAFYHKVPVGHVEAGLRTGDMRRPWPEEGNRRLTTVLTDLHFAPTDRARTNLEAEGIAPEQILVTGNTVIDALHFVRRRLRDDAELQRKVEDRLPALNPGRRLVLVTVHRRENFGTGIERVCAALAELARREDVEILCPVHRNPHVRHKVRARLGGLPRIHLVDPLEYLSFVYAMDSAYLILTDSGGIQEEAPSLGKPVLVMREVTERPEAVEAGTVTLVGTDADHIVRETVRLLDNPGEYDRIAHISNPFGDGHAAERIVEHLTLRMPALAGAGRPS